MVIARNQVIAGAAVAALLAVVAYAGFGVVKKRQFEAQVTQQVAEAGARLEPSLGLDINAPSPPQIGALDAAIVATEASLQQLRAASARVDPALLEAADDYLATVLNVLKRQAGSLRGRQRFADSHRALTAHLAKAGQRGEQWARDAVQLRQQLDRDYFEYNTASMSLGNMLGGYAAARGRIAALLPAVSLPAEADARSTRQRALAAAEATRSEYERAKRLIAPG